MIFFNGGEEDVPEELRQALLQAALAHGCNCPNPEVWVLPAGQEYGPFNVLTVAHDNGCRLLFAQKAGLN
jgi:hypothetical protein